MNPNTKCISRFRFSGTTRSVTRWRRAVEQLVGLSGRRVSDTCWEVEFTASQIRLVAESLWRSESGIGTDANGRPLRWNACITFVTF